MVSFRFLLLLLFVGMAAAAGITTLTNVPGFFAQDSPETDAAQFDYVYTPLAFPLFYFPPMLMGTVLDQEQFWVIGRIYGCGSGGG
jgi:hypothetical protein